MLHKISVLGQVGHIIFPFNNVDSQGIHLAALRLFEGLGLGRFLFHFRYVPAPEPGDFPELAAANFISRLRLNQLQEEIHTLNLASFDPFESFVM